MRKLATVRSRTAMLAIIVFKVCVYAQTPQPSNAPFGVFTGDLQFHPTGDGVHMKVLQTYSYSDIDKHTLTANPGFITDGASIPRALWTVVGSPFTGKYVDAAVIHDVGCDTHKYSWQITHRMFFMAMRAKGGSEDYAKVLYWGVRIGGPRWKETSLQDPSLAELKKRMRAAVGRSSASHASTEEITTADGARVYRSTVEVPLPTRTLSESDAKAILVYIRRTQYTLAGAISIDTIDRLTPLEGELPRNAIPR